MEGGGVILAVGVVLGSELVVGRGSGSFWSRGRFRGSLRVRGSSMEGQSSIKCGVSSQRNLCHFFGS